jgi:uncharacterized protein (TIGR03067 family)
MVLASGTATARGGMTIDEAIPLAEGDYLQFEMNMDEFVNEIGGGLDDENFEGFDELNVEMGQFKAIGTETVTVNGTDYKAVIVLQSWSISFSMTFSEGDYNGTVSISMSMEQKVWWTDDRLTVKGENNMVMEMTFPFEGDNMTIKSNSTDTETYIRVADPVALPLKVGSKWTEESEYVGNTTSRNWDSMSGNWTTSYNEDTITHYNDYEVTGQESVTVPAGTFDCLVVKETDEWTEDYELTYYMDGLLPVKMVSFENGTATMTMELKDYSVAALSSSGDGGDGDGGTDGGDGDDVTDGDDGDDVKDDIEGQWEATDESGDHWSFDFDAGKYVIVSPDGTYKGTYTVDDSADPPTMDMTISEAPEGDEEYEGKVSKAIYKVEDGGLSIAMGEPGGDRPASFDDEGALSLEGSFVTPPEGDGGDDDDDDKDTPGFGALLVLGAMGVAVVVSIVLRRK